MEQKNQPAEQMPQTIGRYQVQEGIGYGAMGAVYKAFDPLIKRTLAIKTIRLDIPRQSPQYKSFIERFYHEARISGTLSHPNIVTLFDIGEEGGLPFLAMEFVEGETIASLIEKGVRFPPEKVIALVSQIGSAVDYAHTKGVIHRDIKPSNLILYEGDRVKVTDFGIAKLVDKEMTQSGTLLGTPSYMSPEQAMGEKLDGRCDIFSLGVCSFEMLSGEQPFPGNNVTSILYKLVHVDPIEPANLEMHGLVPQKWHEVFGKVLAKKPDDRYQTANEFVQDLEYCLGSWFGSAMGDETLSEAGGSVGATVAEAAAQADLEALTLPMRRSVAPSEEVTTVLPVMTAPPGSPGTPPAGGEQKPLLAEPAQPEDEDIPETLHMMAAPEEDSSNPTVLIRAEKTTAMPAIPMPKPPERKEKPREATTPPAAQSAPSPAPVDVPEPAPEVEATLVMASPEPTIRTKAMDVTVKKPPSPPPAKTPVAVPEETVRAPVPKTPPPSVPKTAAAPVPAPPPASPAARRGPTAALILGGLALLALLVMGVGIIVWLQHGGQNQKPQAEVTRAPATTLVASTLPTAPPPTELASGSIHIESQPVGASVSIDGETKGPAPLDLTLPLGKHDVRLDLKGYVTRTQQLVLTAEAPHQDINLALVPPAPAGGSADILSTPFGAVVTIDGKSLGPTPVMDVKLKPGEHSLDIRKDGYEPYHGSVKVEPGQKARVDAQLHALIVAAPTPTPTPADFVDPSKVYAEREVDATPKKLSATSWTYQPKLKSGEQVSVTLSWIVTDTGEVADVQVVESGGKALDEGVAADVRKWRFTPGTKKGVKVKVRVTQKYTFRAG